MPAIPKLRSRSPTKSAYYNPSTTQPSSLLRHLRRSRFILLIAVSLSLFIYYISQRHTPFFKPRHEPSIRYKNVDWSRYAYSQYATNSAYLCNSIMVFEALERLGSKAERILMYPEEWDTDIADRKDRDSQLLVMAREWYHVKLVPVKVKRFERDEIGRAGKTWDESATKLLTFNQTQYDRILHLDSDITLFKHMDDLFLLPRAPVAMLRAYWALPEKKSLTSMLILLEPSEIESRRLMRAIEADSWNKNDYDMEIINNAFKDSALVLPHRQYGLLSGEFRSKRHQNYLGNDYEEWDPDQALREASLVHFSDWPLPKPWIMWPRNQLQEEMPKCESDPGTEREKGCRNREVWLELYNDFRRRRKDICALLSVPAPEWPPRSKGNSTVHERT